MAEVLGFVVVAVVLTPHALPGTRLAPSTAIAMWISVLALRALLAVCLAAIVVLYLPPTQLFTILTHWCLHAALPFVATHLGFDGHRLGDAAILVPSLVITASAISVVVGLGRGARAVGRWLGSSCVGDGPHGSVIVGGREVVVAAAGLRRPRLVVSTGALLRLDESELRLGVEHERAHIARRHRYVLVAAQLLCGISRLIPGSRRALANLEFQIERDADECAAKATGERLALARAICKAAMPADVAGGSALAALSGSGAPDRVRLLVSGSARGRGATTFALALTTAAVALTLGLGAAVPALASAGVHEMGKAGADRVADCR